MMATTTIAFTPTATANFQFPATLDGQDYNCVVRWNIYGQRYYLNCYDSTGALVFCQPLIESPDSADISITAGYFTTTLVYRLSTGNIEISG